MPTVASPRPTAAPPWPHTLGRAAGAGTRSHEPTRPLLMGICNVTPDSFADGGRLYPDGHPEAAVGTARRLAAEGAAIIDVGGESTRPGAEPVEVGEELARVVPVVAALAADGLCVSVDTTKPEVAEAALAAGACIVNDVGGGAPDLLEVVAGASAGYVLMHARGTPATMRTLTDYDDVVRDVADALTEGLTRCARAGIDLDRVVTDPGIGFAKTAAQSLALLAAIPRFTALGRPVLIGASRKSFLHGIGGADTVADRLEGSLAVAALATRDGAGVLRVHDVAATRRAVAAAAAIDAAR